MKIEPFTSDDISSVNPLQPQGWPDISKSFRYYTASTFCTPVKMISGTQIIGTGCIIFYKTTAWLAHIIVSEENRNQGIGQALVRHLLEMGVNRGISTFLLVGTTMGERVYRKEGFEPVSDYLCYEGLCAESDVRKRPDNVRDCTAGFRKQVLDLDRYVTGENRSELISPYLKDARIVIRNGGLEGFWLPGLGDGPVIAISEPAATDLLNEKLRVKDHIILPEENHNGIAFLESRDWVEKEGVRRRMCLGKPVTWKPEYIYSRIGGNFG